MGLADLTTIAPSLTDTLTASPSSSCASSAIDFGSLSPRLLPHLAIRVDAANRFLRDEYCQEFTNRFGVAPSEKGTAFVPLRRKDLDLVFSIQHERVVGRDNTVSFANRVWQLERSKLRAILAGCRVTIHEHLDETVSITFGPHLVGRYNALAVPLEPKQKTKAMEMPPLRKATNYVASLSGLGKSRQKRRDFPTFPQPLLLDN